jgi:hypothetical protein
MTHRQFLAWRAWLQLELNRPSRSDQYIMQLTAEVRRILHKHPNRVKLKDFLLKWESPEERRRRLASITPEYAEAMAMARWMGVLGGGEGIRVVEIDDPNYDPHKPLNIDFDAIEPHYIVDASSSQDGDEEEGEEE